ncbi:Uncharacterised protein [Corynebacterium kutscheri]|uniref:Bacterial EndoU nuclease domain-containing protein n=1 Tax=Corynebacterium kutscheri TaxID=35755 RepID=A0AB38VSZ3_9CORY|nr:EndoU domain-containing protein [Corynebacterium kutscheri]VEH07007.1 Uncharacterised protein [Corynebacterium kutscheri]VEH79503.1 Uncharacterised protein [Corynebacterium kutscheri]
MVRNPELDKQYSDALDMLRMLAQRDLVSWWKQTAELSFADQKKILTDPFYAIVHTYGEYAAHAAANYLFLTRSLDEHLAGLEYPEVADPVGFEQARGSFRWAMNTSRKGEDFHRALALRKLGGIVNRLVAQPARDTVYQATVRAGTLFARLPEPGACAFCLMLASRGGVYSRDTVGAGGRQFHDNCRCLGIEVNRDGSDLPKINRELQDLWAQTSREFGGSLELRDWQHTITAMREQRGGNIDWPKLQYARTPRYRHGGKSMVFEGEKLPSLKKMPGHVLHGWRDHIARDGSGRPHDESLADGHRWDSKRAGASKFPKTWTDQKIVDAVRDTLENPSHYLAKGTRRIVWRETNSVLIQAEYDALSDGRVVFNTAYPVRKIKKGAKSAY